MPNQRKSKEEILDMYAKDKMVEWNLRKFRKSHPSLFAVIGISMEEYAKQEAIVFLLDTTGEMFKHNAEQLYTLFLTSKS